MLTHKAVKCSDMYLLQLRWKPKLTGSGDADKQTEQTNFREQGKGPDTGQSNRRSKKRTGNNLKGKI